MDVTTVAGLIRFRFGRQRGDQAQIIGHATHRFTEPNLVIGGAQGRGMTQRQLMLAVTQFGVIGIDRNILGRKGGHDGIDDLRSRVHGDGAKTKPRIHRRVMLRLAAVASTVEEAKFALKGRLYGQPLLGGAPNHPLEKGAGTGAPRLFV